MLSIVRAGGRSAHIVHVEVIGSTLRARSWLTGADWFTTARSPVVLVVPPATYLLRHQVARAAQRAAEGSAVYVLLNGPAAPSILPWHAVDWVEGPNRMLRPRPVPAPPRAVPGMPREP